MIVKIGLIFFFIFASSNTLGNENEFAQFVANSKPSNLSQSTWEDALKAYFSHCGQGQCACTLVVADSNVSGADNSSVQMAVTAFKGMGGGVSFAHLWSGWGSRKASAASAPAKNVSKKLMKCRRRNGAGALRGNQVCVMYAAGLQCRDVSIFRSIMDELEIPESAGYTSFYFSAPMQNETYKFHDFYGCSNGPPCPRTLGCLGLERKAMKSLCLNHMGSNGTNGYTAPERAGGVYLHFHNVGRPQANYGQYQQGFQKFKSGACQDVSTVSLGTGQFIDPSHVEMSNNYEYSGGGSSAIPQSLNAMEQGLQTYSQLEMQNQQQQESDIGGAPPSEEEIQKKVLAQCEESTQKSCPNVESGIIADYCEDVESYEREACEFEKAE